MKTIARILLAAAAILIVCPLVAEEQGRRYIVILKQRTTPAPDIAALGGRIESRQDDQLVVTIPTAALAALKGDPSVLYTERVGGSPSDDDEAQLIGVPSDPPPGPATQSIRFTPRALGTISWDSGSYAYDGAGNIVSIGTDNYLYDGVQRLKQSSTVGTIEQYTYDGFGNMKTRTNTTIPTVQPSTNRYATYSYDEMGSVISDGSYTFLYDAFGQPLSKIYGYQNDTLEHYIYTPGDERIGVKRGGWWIWSVRDEGGKVLRQYKSSASSSSTPSLWLEDFVWRDGLLLGSQRPVEMGGRRHFHLDHLGTPRLITADNGQRISSHDYYPFGDEKTSVWQEGPSAGGFDREEPMKFTGHERDFAGGMGGEDGHTVDEMHARSYSPLVGRFFLPDPVLGNLLRPQSWNRYSYVFNNPMNYTDPSGTKVDDSPSDHGTSSELFELNFVAESQELASEFFNSRAYRFISGAANAYSSDQLLGAGRVNSADDDYQFGQLVGDTAALINGAQEFIAGGSTDIVALVADAIPGGAVVGIPVGIIATGIAAHGGGVTIVAGPHMMSGIKQLKAGKHGTFRGRDAKRANDKAMMRVVRELGLNKKQQQRLHHEISGGDLNYEQIKAVAKAMFGR